MLAVQKLFDILLLSAKNGVFLMISIGIDLENSKTLQIQ